MMFKDMPAELQRELRQAEKVTICEEHVAQGSFGNSVAVDLLKQNIAPKAFQTFNVHGYPGRFYGSQKFHRGENKILFADIEGSL
jgi:transketolase C-terminal domain/subunit